MGEGTLKPSATALAREPEHSEGFEYSTKRDHGKAGGDEDRESVSPRVRRPFVAARPEVNANAWRSPSPKRRAKAAASGDTSLSSVQAGGTRRGSLADRPPNVSPTDDDTSEPTQSGGVSSEEKDTATAGSRQESRQRPEEKTARAGVSKSSGGNKDGGRCDRDGSAGRIMHRDMAPKMLLEREAGAAARRAERAAAAREKEERELKLSSSFRAKEVEQGVECCIRLGVFVGFEARWSTRLVGVSIQSTAGHPGYARGVVNRPGSSSGQEEQGSQMGCNTKKRTLSEGGS